MPYFLNLLLKRNKLDSDEAILWVVGCAKLDLLCKSHKNTLTRTSFLI